VQGPNGCNKFNLQPPHHCIFHGIYACFDQMQIVGGIMGILLVVGLMPGAIMNGGAGSPGCFGKGPELTDAQLFGW
jgi:hypothetical protein